MWLIGGIGFFVEKIINKVILIMWEIWAIMGIVTECTSQGARVVVA